MHSPIRTESVGFVGVVNWSNWYKIRFSTKYDEFGILRIGRPTEALLGTLQVIHKSPLEVPEDRFAHVHHQHFLA
jgi:hypothetical protein